LDGAESSSCLINRFWTGDVWISRRGFNASALKTPFIKAYADQFPWDSANWARAASISLSGTGMTRGPSVQTSAQRMTRPGSLAARTAR
jgi:hypothetical protein